MESKQLGQVKFLKFFCCQDCIHTTIFSPRISQIPSRNGHYHRFALPPIEGCPNNCIYQTFLPRKYGYYKLNCITQILTNSRLKLQQNFFSLFQVSMDIIPISDCIDPAKMKLLSFQFTTVKHFLQNLKSQLS